MERAYTFDDLVQEGYIVYFRCLREYASKVDNRAWFMSLFKTAYTNHLTDLARARIHEPDADVDVVLERMSTQEPVELSTLVDILPDELVQVVTTFVEAPEELFDALSRLWNDSGNKRRNRKNAIRQLSSALGLGGRDVRAEIHEALREE